MKYFLDIFLPKTESQSGIDLNTLSLRDREITELYGEWLHRRLLQGGRIDSINYINSFRVHREGNPKIFSKKHMLKSNVKDRGIPPTGVIIPKSNKTFSVEEDGGMLALYYFDAHNRAMVLHKDQSERVHLFPEVEQYLKENHPEHFIENDEHKINAMDKIGVLVLDFKEILRSRYIKEREYYDYKDEIYNFLKSIKSNLLHISIDHRDIRKQKLLATMNSTIIHWGEKLSTNYDEDDILDIDTLFSLLYEIEACVQSITDNHGAITPEVNEACSENRENVVSIFSIPKK